MKVFVVFAALVTAASADDGNVANVTTLLDLPPIIDKNRIINGQAATSGQFPWQVVVNFRTSSGNFLCGGSLIEKHWVLTAAHCTQNAISFDLKFGGLTKNNQEIGRVDIKASKYIVHPNYNHKNLNNDIALIKLPNPIAFSKRIKPIKLPSRGRIIGESQRVTVSGWGRTKDALGSNSKTLQYVELETITNKACAKVYGSDVIRSSTLCCSSNFIRSSCSGDSGGPLVSFESKEAVLVGIVSFVHNAGCSTGNPSGFVRTESYLDWIAQNTGMPV